MADILKIFTAEQLGTLFKNKVLADGVGLTDFNEGAKIRALLEIFAELTSSIGMDFKEGVYKSIPIALYDGFGFARKGATKSIGLLRPYRKPAFWVKYTGTGTEAKITSTSTEIYSAVIGAPGDAFNFAYSSYPTIGDIVTAIDGLSNWEATLVKDTGIDSTTLYQYTSKEAISATNYENTEGLDIMLDTAVEILVPTGYSVSVNQQTIITTEDGTIEEGESGVQISSENSIAGSSGDISANAIDTLNGKGFIDSSIDGIEYAINDSAFSGGEDQESNSDRQIRFVETVNSLNAGTKNGIISALKGITGVRSVGMRTSYPFKGTNTIIVDDGTGSLSAELLAELDKVLYGDPNDLLNYPGKNAEGIGYVYVAPTIVPVSVGITVTRLSNINVDLEEIKIDVQTAVEQYINTRALGENVLLSEIIRVGKNSNAAVYDLIVNSPGSNVDISEEEFAKTGAGTGASVSVTAVIETNV